MRRLVACMLVTICIVCLSACTKDEGTDRQSVSDFMVATFEYKDDTGYKLITSEIGSLHTFDSLSLKSSNAEFSGQWNYRIIFNPSSYSKNAEEVIILFGDSNLSINGKVYESDGCSYSEILNWAADKYDFFDYELIGN